MKSAELIPLPEIDIERDRVAFNNLSFPIGFDEERLLINTRAIRRTAAFGDMGSVIIAGSVGEKSENSATISSVNSDGSAIMGMMKRKTPERFVNGVRVMSTEEIEVRLPFDINPRIIRDYFPAPVVVKANLTARDELLQSTKKYKRGLFDTKGHADFLQRTISEGLSEGANQRYKDTKFAPIRYFTYGWTSIVLGESIFEHNAIPFTNLLIVWGGFEALDAYRMKRNYNAQFKDRNWSALMGLDRKLGAQALARTSKFVKVRK